MKKRQTKRQREQGKTKRLLGVWDRNGAASGPLQCYLMLIMMIKFSAGLPSKCFVFSSVNESFIMSLLCNQLPLFACGSDRPSGERI
jgi:hypothetical protein